MCNLTTRRPGAGFTLIEVLVTLVILMIGLLGIAGLMAQGQRASFEAYQRQQALALANDMAERVKANRPGADSTAVATTYDGALAVASPAGTGSRFADLTTNAITNCASGNCTTGDLVLYDAAVWDGLLQGAAAETATSDGAAIGPILKPRGCIQVRNSTVCPACGGPPASRQVTYRISVAWQGNYSTAAPDAADTCGAGEYNNPRTGAADETFRRLVGVDVYTVIPCACP
jgi:type IV pilus assembly protein PilV